MAKNPETLFIERINALLPIKRRASSAKVRQARGLKSTDGIHYEKMMNPFSSGTADSWYSGTRCDLWVEYKYLPELPKRDNTLIDLQKLLRTDQIIWLGEREKENRHVIIIVGCPDGGVIFRPTEIPDPIETWSFKEAIVPDTELARWIEEYTLGAVKHEIK
jgi:hypothetical protein